MFPAYWHSYTCDANSELSVRERQPIPRKKTKRVESVKQADYRRNVPGSFWRFSNERRGTLPSSWWISDWTCCRWGGRFLNNCQWHLERKVGGRYLTLDLLMTLQMNGCHNRHSGTIWILGGGCEWSERKCFETTPFGLLENAPVLKIAPFNWQTNGDILISYWWRSLFTKLENYWGAETPLTPTAPPGQDI